MSITIDSCELGYSPYRLVSVCLSAIPYLVLLVRMAWSNIDSISYTMIYPQFCSLPVLVNLDGVISTSHYLYYDKIVLGPFLFY